MDEAKKAPPLQSNLSGRVALVTGGATGIGAATVRELARRGARVALTYLQQEDRAQQLARQIGGCAVQVDLQDRKGTREALDRIADELGPIEILVLNAGGIKDGLLAFLAEEDWDRLIDLNLSSAYRVTQRILRGMLRGRWGRIVAVSSASGRMGQVGQTAYSAAKGGLISFVRALAREVGPYGVTVNAVAPGWIATPLLEQALSRDRLEKHLEELPLRRIGQPEEVAAAIAFLVSEEASYITGQVLSVDGGLVMA